MDAFETTYKKKLVPILERHDLEESSEGGRPTVEGVFSRLFELGAPGEVAAKKVALRGDPAWEEMLRRLGTTFGTTRPDGLIRHRFGLYRAPAGPGRQTDLGVGFRQGLWQSFSVQDGLPSATIESILQDREGNLWLGTPGAGVSRYDGAGFTAFTIQDGLSDNTVGSMVEDWQGRLWFGTSGNGVCRYDGKEFVAFTSEDGLAHDAVPCILEDRQGALWFGSGEPCRQSGAGVSRYDGSRFAIFTTKDGLAHNTVSSILEDREGNLWFGCGSPCGAREGGVSRYDGKEFVTFTTEDGLACNHVFCMVEDREANLWFGTYGGGLSRYDPSASSGGAGNAFVTFPAEQGVPPFCVRCILQDQEGNLWLGTQGGGVSRYAGEEFTAFTTEHGLANDIVLCLLEDREGYLWFGTMGGGLSRHDGAQFAHFTIEQGLPSNGVMRLLEDREGDLWFGTWSGACRYDGTRFTTLDGLAGKNIHSIAEDRKGNLWFGTWGTGVSCYDGTELRALTDQEGLPGNVVLAILEDGEGRLWFGTRTGGVARYDGEQFVVFTTRDGLAGHGVRSMLEDREGHLWFGTSGGGVTRYDGKGFQTFTTQDGLADNSVNGMLQDRQGNLWFGTEQGGLGRFDGKQFTTFTTQHGLTHNKVVSILEDREGKLWIGTYGGGVSRYDGLVFQSLTRRDGLVHDAAHQILQDQKGDVWISTDGGVTRYRPSSTPPRIRVTEVIADRRYGAVGEVRLPSSQKLLIIEFRGHSAHSRPDGMAYVQRLKGYEADWRPNYTGREEYHDLPLGEYTFEVKAVDRDLNYSEPASVRVVVEPDPRLEAFAHALSGTPDEFVGESNALRKVEQQLVEAAPTDLTVLISGETGTGKGLAARSVHASSPRASHPFVPVNCGAIPEGLVESELFGHEKGAFTGAVARKLGKIELAEGGTLFLDEIGDLSAATQAKLLRFLEDRTFERVGGTEILQADVRVIAATNRDLRAMVAAGQFREDLYFRIQEFAVHLPPLRERREDIPDLASYFMGRMAAHLGKEVTRFAPEALAALHGYEWPGNVRELEHAVYRAVVVCQGTAIQREDIPLEPAQLPGARAEAFITPEEYERRYIREVLERTGWVISGSDGAATILGLPESTLRYRLKKLGIVRE